MTSGREQPDRHGADGCETPALRASPTLLALSPAELRRTPRPRPRIRGLPMVDAVTFVARCPACGQDAEWVERREDTRLRATVSCTCG